jgi:hypothetical protein
MEALAALGAETLKRPTADVESTETLSWRDRKRGWVALSGEGLDHGPCLQSLLPLTPDLAIFFGPGRPKASLQVLWGLPVRSFCYDSPAEKG